MGCDPSGSVVFISKLFTGLISNKDLTKQSGLLKPAIVFRMKMQLWLIKDLLQKLEN
jgi:hypothetical protein